MKRKTLVSLILALLITTVIIGVTQAGSTADFGQLTGIPDVGTINFYAWDTSANLVGNIPSKILTEDNWLCSTGPNQGYFYNTNTTIGELGPTWAMTLYNLTNDYNTSRPISMVFGGLATGESGNIWAFDFEYTMNPSIKDWKIIGTKYENMPACPTLNETVENEEGDKIVKFYGMPLTTYQIYRSQNASGASNGYSNGVYLWIGSTTTNAGGEGTYVDTSYEPTAPGWWYEVVLINSTGVNGCHSEPVGPTSVVLSNFSASFDLKSTSVQLAWETVSEVDILGFNILRSDGTSTKPVQINTELLPANQPGSTSGGEYIYIDSQVKFGQTYAYYIEVVGSSGRTSRFGPEELRTGFSIFLPLLKY